MINRKSLDEFLTRQTQSFDWIKDLSTEELDDALSKMDPPPNFGKIKSWDHQKALFLIINELQRFAPLIDMGGGKSLLVLMQLKYLKQCTLKPRAIIFVPYITSVETWVEEVAKHAPDLKCVPLLGTSKQNISKLNEDGDLFVACYQSAVAMVTETTVTKEGKTKWKLSAQDVRAYFKGFNVLVCDEIHKCKSPSSLYFKMCRAISAQCDWVFGLTGTPFGRDLTDLWAQFYLIDFGETLGPSLGFYREAFFKSKKNRWGGYDYRFVKKLLPDLKRILKNRSIRYEISELRDMPPKRYVIRHLPLAEGSEAYAAAAVMQINDSRADKSYHQIEGNYLRLRQLSSGFMSLKAEDDSKIQVKFEPIPKLEALKELIEGIPIDRKVVIFHHFVFTNSLLSAALDELKIKHARIWSGQRDQIGQLRWFKSDSDCRILVINSKSGSSSLNLQNANYIIFYEQPDSPIDRSQAEARCWRAGQTENVIIYDLLVDETVDVRLHKSNKLGKELLKELLGKDGGL